MRRKAQVIGKDAFIQAATAAAQTKLSADIPLSCIDNYGDFAAPFGEVELRPEEINTSTSQVSVTLGIYVAGKRINSRTVNLRPDVTAARIAAGTPVKVVMKSSGVTVEVGGKARTGGFLGQTITVVTDTGSTLEGRVIGPDRVEVKI